MFKTLSAKFNNIFSGLHGKTITKESIEKAIQEIKSALLEADVSLESVKSFITELEPKLLGESVIKGANAVQMIMKLTQDEITRVLSENQESLKLQGKKPDVIMMVGLQGAGKTTTTAKLALKLKKAGKSVLLASVDVRRPAAKEQLEILAKRIEVSSLEIVQNETVEQIVERALKTAKNNFDVLILDTAGRSEIEEELMEELAEIKRKTNPCEILLVMDAFFGRKSLELATAFNEKLEITGAVITRMDGDSRGGLAFNIKYFLKKPIKFYGHGEKPEDIEEFYPERIASRILDMGDIVSFVESAKEKIDEEQMRKIEEKMKKGKFDFEDFLVQIGSMKKMGGLAKIASFIPGASKFAGAIDDSKQKEIYKQEAIILSMTLKERRNPSLLLAHSRKDRIAKGSGVKLADVNKLLKQFDQMKMMMTMFGKMDKSKLEGIKNPEDLLKMMRP